MTREAVIVSYARTGLAKSGRGGFNITPPMTLGAHAVKHAVAKSGVEADFIEDCYMGNNAHGAANIGRQVALLAGMPVTTAGVSINRFCSSGLQSIAMAANHIRGDGADCVVAGGVESISIPGGGMPREAIDPELVKIAPAIFMAMIDTADIVAKRYGVSREAQDAFSLESQLRMAAAQQAGLFKDEIVPIEIETPEGMAWHTQDEGIRFDATLESIAGVKLLAEGGTLTAASSSQICDGSSAALVVSEAALKRYNLTPMARVHTLTVTAGDPVIMLEEPLFATDKALARSGLSIGDIDLYEVNEAFAPVPMAWLKHTGADPDRLNVNGGAIALGHPLGASGTKLMATLLHALKARGGKYGLQTMCEGGGVANVTIVERL
mgnify:CR=1 FL=1